MRSRSVAVAVLLLVTLGALAAPVRQTGADTPPLCFDLITEQLLPATKWLDTPGTLVGTNGRDVLVGSPGSDTIKGLGGPDVICTEPANVDYEGLDRADGGSGNDSIQGHGHLIGGSGSDHLRGFDPGTIVDGGSGNDVVVGTDDKIGGVDRLLGGSGGDVVRNRTGNPKIDCGAGYDLLYNDGATDVRRCEGTTTQD